MKRILLIAILSAVIVLLIFRDESFKKRLSNISVKNTVLIILTGILTVAAFFDSKLYKKIKELKHKLNY
ncbi:MAG: hypothetical protein JW894_07315 [Bacteroidales bacterium]|nr:hypothetical protein [Bacteroidales bacterium]